uniref:C2H2-type domain-containing protein n=1 Tax=Knipowitschia caucasica TaxID=637954 RepID=A0AAV2LGM9_KNICA
MPRSIPLLQSHVGDCLDFCRSRCKECPDGLMCSSTFPNHYRDFDHTLLAQSRANGSLVVPQIITGEINHSRLANNHEARADNSPLKTSQDYLPLDSLPSSPLNNSQTKSPTIRNGLLLLRSPGAQDLKKKKGWSSPKVPKAVSSVQGSKAENVSTPSKTAETQTHGCVLQSTASDVDDAISYSPLSELPAEGEAKHTGARKTLFDFDPGGRENDRSIAAFSDSDDILFAEFLDDFDEEEEKESPSLNYTQMASASQPSHLETSNKATDTCVKEKPGLSLSVGSSNSSILSPQSIVLERLRDTILETEKSSHQSSSKTNSEMSVSDKTTPQKIPNKAAQSGSLKQTDIAVFFGLKPLPVKETEHVSVAVGEKQAVKTQKKSRQRPGPATTAGSSQAAVATVESEGGSKRTGRKGWRRWSNAAAEEGKYPRCPFYKKIPGTTFVVDAFRYGPIDGISAYFLTHFHSDHYDGLRKTSTLPIYCNKVSHFCVVLFRGALC